MRTTLLILAALPLALAAPAALAHTHGPCSAFVSSTGVVHVDVYRGSCTGVTVRLTNAVCVFQEAHVISGVHTPILNDDGCETGVIVERLSLP